MCENFVVIVVSTAIPQTDRVSINWRANLISWWHLVAFSLICLQAKRFARNQIIFSLLLLPIIAILSYKCLLYYIFIYLFSRYVLCKPMRISRCVRSLLSCQPTLLTSDSFLKSGGFSSLRCVSLSSLPVKKKTYSISYLSFSVSFSPFLFLTEFQFFSAFWQWLLQSPIFFHFFLFFSFLDFHRLLFFFSWPIFFS